LKWDTDLSRTSTHPVYDENGKKIGDYALTDLYNGLLASGKKIINNEPYFKFAKNVAGLGQDIWIKGTDLTHLSAYDTGGYTGAWGTEGRLAMLHQKEIVLNAKDTENLLATVEIVRALNDHLNANIAYFA
jgi:hypothetical protein